MSRHYGPLSTFGMSIVLGMTVIDQGVKLLVQGYLLSGVELPFGQTIPILPILSLYLTYNEGIAFSLLAGAGALTLIAVTAAISIAVLWMWVRARENGLWAAAGYALIVGGAIGNLIDRIAYGHVVDYLLLHFGDWSFFVFNFADAALTLGPVCLIIGMLGSANRAPTS
jgi:signal peptidase II